MTPLEEVHLAERRLLLKREDAHELGSFKWRGALPTLEAYKRDGAETVITASTGNHGAATAWAAERLGMKAVVFASEDASRTKVDAMRSLGADVRLVGADFDQAKEEAERFAADVGVLFVDGLEREQYDGYAVVADEILDQAEEPPAAVVVPVGNGALFGGIGLGICRRAPEIARVGVVAKDAPCMLLSWEAGKPVACERADTFADGIAVRVVVPVALEVVGEVATRMLQVSEREIARAVGALHEVGVRAEGAAAAPLAAVPQLDDLGDPLVLVITGRNIDDDLLRRAVEQPDSFPE
ncbi:MAG TPA: pyridoxal-phosphate dependent enzyme [Gaiellaceae bacterium]|jgi:threonine dehydratase|nr:pyridoxal-phosphate dependent enzyme [Gaiellaceae bacterium]